MAKAHCERCGRYRAAVIELDNVLLAMHQEDGTDDWSDRLLIAVARLRIVAGIRPAEARATIRAVRSLNSAKAKPVRLSSVLFRED